MNLWKRFRRSRALRAHRKVAADKINTPLREFIYLDDVSVYSLISSRRGELVQELTETQSASLRSETSAEVEVDAKVAKGKATALLEGTRTRESQVLRKAIIQSTFKDLYDGESKSLSLKNPRAHEKAPDVSTLAQLNALAVESQPLSHWIIDPLRLGRGAMVEIDVELRTHPAFQLQALISTLSEMIQSNPSLASMVDAASVTQAIELNSIIERFLVGLIPIFSPAVDYQIVSLGGKDWLVHKSLISQIPVGERPAIRPLHVAGLTEERLYWKDIRRLLFSGARFTVLCRVGNDGLTSDWNPVKLMDLLEPILPNMSAMKDFLGVDAIRAISRTSGPVVDDSDGLENSMITLSELLAASHEVENVTTFRSQVIQLAEGLAQSPTRLTSLRVASDKVFELVVGRVPASTDREQIATLREQALESAGYEADGSRRNSNSVEAASPGGQAVESSALDSEIIAIFW